MKVIDLLNKIANGEEVPKKFIYVDKENVRYIFDIEVDKDYWCEELGNWFFDNFSIQTILNDEIEIIEKDKEIEEIEFDEIDELTNYDIYFYPECSDDSKENFKNKINQLIRNQKKIINELKKGK